jgi:hypothetical protein
MKRNFLLLAALFAATGPALTADLIVNGSFESPDVLATPGHEDRPLGGWFPVPPGGSTIAGWQVVNAPVSITRMPYNEGYETLLAGEGLQSADLTAESLNGQGGIEQSVVTTPGKEYVLTFQLCAFPGSSVYGGPIRVRATAGSTTAEFRHDPTVPVPGGVWQSFALPFRANNATTVIRLQNLQANHWCGLDRVAIAEVTASDSPHNFSLVSSTVDGGGGTSASNNARFSVSGTIGQPDAGFLESNGRHLFGGFWGPVNQLKLTREESFVRLSWDFGLGYGELQTARELSSDGTANWRPVSLAGHAASVVLPATDATRFFRIAED